VIFAVERGGSVREPVTGASNLLRDQRECWVRVPVSGNAGLDAFHVLIGQAKVMPDLMNEDVSYDVTQGFIILGPVIKDRPPVEQHPVGQFAGLDGEPFGQPAALEQAEQIERRLQPHVLEDIVIGEIRHDDGHVAVWARKSIGQFGIGIYGPDSNSASDGACLSRQSPV
jgi:hypothetical protein